MSNQVIEKSIGVTIEPRSRNQRVNEVIAMLRDKSVLERIAAYKETHSKWEKSGGW